MYKSLRKNSVIALALVVGMSLNDQPLHAEWTGGNSAEVTMATLRGVCSSIEYTLKNDDSKSAHFTRLLISILRVTHGGLAMYNHIQDYPSNYLYGLNALDNIQGLAHGAQLLQALAKNNVNSTNIAKIEEDFFLDESSAVLIEKKPIQVSPVNNQSITPERLEFVRKYALPAIESIAAALIACTGNGQPVIQKALFTGQALLTLSRTCQIYLDQEEGDLKNMLGSIAIVNAVYSTYQLLFNDSDLNTWVNDKREQRERAQREEEERIQRGQRELEERIQREREERERREQEDRELAERARREWEERIERLRQERERLERENRERQERERQERERLERERLERERLERERLERERAQREQLERLQRERMQREYREWVEKIHRRAEEARQAQAEEDTREARRNQYEAVQNIFPAVRDALNEGGSSEKIDQRLPFAVFALDKNASLNDVNQAYKKMAPQFHPDRNPDAEEAMKVLNDAIDVLRKRLG